MKDDVTLSYENTTSQVVDAVISGRQSVRAFLPQSVPRQLLEHIVEIALRAPSGSNTQPWRVYVVTGATRQRIVDAVCQAQSSVDADPSQAEHYQEPFDYYPPQWFSPYIERRRENGWGLYGLLGIAKGEKTKMADQQRRNFCFFDAPVGLFFTLDRRMGNGAKIDTGMLMQNIMLAAKAHGLDTCAQAAWNRYHRLILPLLKASSEEELVCGMALGYADHHHIVNTFRTPRVDMREISKFLD